jgi:hypothetical protein
VSIREGAQVLTNDTLTASGYRLGREIKAGREWTNCLLPRLPGARGQCAAGPRRRRDAFWMGAGQYEHWKQTHLKVDVVEGRGGGFSLEAPEGVPLPDPLSAAQ